MGVGAAALLLAIFLAVLCCCRGNERGRPIFKTFQGEASPGGGAGKKPKTNMTVGPIVPRHSIEMTSIEMTTSRTNGEHARD